MRATSLQVQQYFIGAIVNNQNTSVRLATAPQSFAAYCADASRQIMRSVNTGEQGRQVIWDMGRGRNLVTIERICTVSATCSSLPDSLAFVDALRAFTLSRRPYSDTVPLSTALEIEDEADGEEDRALFAFMMARTPANRARAIEALRQQEMSSRTLADALAREGGGHLSLVSA